CNIDFHVKVWVFMEKPGCLAPFSSPLMNSF
ncbi:MAG: hypothetical protein ACI94D_001340, partial [Neolewinella sp.]